ncbi:MAG: sigma-70 family RNA polymerase sigma factor [Lentisphaeraceae bacterium]|nr:sigma-70 family RNA polymerase sigma factor [Lentisphaeraceae bacterium]
MADEWKTRQTLLQRAKNPSDQQAWEDFVFYYEKFIFHILHKMNLASADFDDLVQDVLLKLWKNIDKYDKQKARFRTWLGVTIKNTVLNHFESKAKRQQQKQVLVDEDENLINLELVSQPELEDVIAEEWKRYISGMAMRNIESVFSGKAIEVFKLSVDGLSSQEISEKCGVSIDSVYTLKNRVKSRFVKEIKSLLDELEF